MAKFSEMAKTSKKVFLTNLHQRDFYIFRLKLRWSALASVVLSPSAMVGAILLQKRGEFFILSLILFMN